MPTILSPAYTPYGASRQVWESRAPEILIPGPAGTGKTRGNLEKAHLACLKYPGCRICLIRKTRKSLTQSVLVTLENQVFPSDWRRWFGNSGRDHRSTYRYPNGSEMVPCGMDDPLKIMSSEWDRGFIFEAIELTEEDYECVTVRVRDSHTPYNQTISDTNPGPSLHWLLKRAKNGKMEYYPSVHEDNPKYFDQALRTWTPQGEKYLATLANLTGNRRRRLLEGVWCADEAAVFDHDVLDRHLERCRPPDYCLKIGHQFDGAARDVSIAQQEINRIKVEKKPLPTTAQDWQHRLLWWGPLEYDPEAGILRPPQNEVYVLSADISGGNGASNSIIGIAARGVRQKWGEWVSATISPGGLARMMAILGLWCGGMRRVGHLIWEANYPGPYFGRQLSLVLQYPSLYSPEGKPGTRSTGQSDRLGWWNHPHSKRDAVEGLRDAYHRDEFSNPSEQAIQEAMQWLRWPTGDMGPGHLQEESQDAKKTHGDRVIADMLLILGMNIALPPIEKPVPRDPIVRQRMEMIGMLSQDEKERGLLESESMEG